MSTKLAVKIIGFGLINYFVRFFVGGFLYLGVKMNPLGFAYGLMLTATALIAAYLLLRFVMKPRSSKEAIGIGVAWAAIALVLDIATAKPIVGVDVTYLLSEVQTWTRLIVIVAVAPLTVSRSSPR